MHLIGPYMTTTKYNSKGKKKPNTAAQRKADAEHAAWLKKRGLHPDQKSQKATPSTLNNLPDYQKESRKVAPLGNNIAVKGGFKTGVMDNLHKEKPQVQAKIKEWATRVAPLYNKGGLQVITDGTDITTIGSKSRRG